MPGTGRLARHRDRDRLLAGADWVPWRRRECVNMAVTDRPLLFPEREPRGDHGAARIDERRRLTEVSGDGVVGGQAFFAMSLNTVNTSSSRRVGDSRHVSLPKNLSCSYVRGKAGSVPGWLS